jgi:hypothetical protein
MSLFCVNGPPVSGKALAGAMLAGLELDTGFPELLVDSSYFVR